MCFSEFIRDCKSIPPIFATETLVLALHTDHWDPHSSLQLPKHVFSSDVYLQLCLGFMEKSLTLEISLQRRVSRIDYCICGVHCTFSQDNLAG